MSSLRVQLLGTFQVTQGGRSLTKFRTGKIRALLAYLAVESDLSHSRERLASLFWPEMDNQKAPYNLRLSLHRLKQTLGDDAALRIDRQAVRLDAARTWLDVAEFEEAITVVSRHAHMELHHCRECAQRLEKAVDLYRGDFLTGFFLKENVEFDNWAAIWRERLHQEAQQALTWLVDYHEENGRFVEAIIYARRQLELEPWQEAAHRKLMQLLANTGQNTAAMTQYERCRRVLHDELGVSPQPETTRLFEKIRSNRTTGVSEGKESRYPIPFSPAQRISAFLPAMATPFVGRAAEMETLGDLLIDPSTRLVTIAGAGGMGKTRLALACAATETRHHTQYYPHGVYFVPLDGLHSADHILPAIAQALSFTPATEDGATDDAQLLAYLQPRQTLLVLDNFEQILDADGGERATAVLVDLLQHALQLKLLVTSRERLNLQMERFLILEGLPCSAEGGADAAHSPAIQLFLLGARRLLPNYQIPPEDIPHLVALCRLLDGMPLGIELAAAWVEMLSPAEIVKEIRANLDFLAVTHHDWPARHRSMRGVFDASWARLSRPEQQVLRRLSLFRGGFTRAAAREVAGHDQDRASLLRLLASLVRKSFLRHDRLSERYEMHALLRHYGVEKLVLQAEFSELQQRHATYYCRWLETQTPILHGERQTETLALIEADSKNIRAAWERAVASEAADLLAGAASGLGTYFLRRGRYTDGQSMFEAAVKSLQPAAGDTAMHALARLWYWRAMFEPAFDLRQKHLQKSLEFMQLAGSHEHDLRIDKAAALLEMGIVFASQGDHETAEQFFTQSYALQRIAGNQWGEANILFELGVRTWRRGEYVLADRWFNQCLRLRCRLGDDLGAALALEGLGGTAMFSGQPASAFAYMRQSFEIYNRLGDQIGMARLKIKLAQMSWYERLEGLDLFEEGLASLKEMGDRRNVALWTVILAMFIADHDIERALLMATEGQTLCRELGRQRGMAIADGVFSRAALVAGRYEEALERACAYLSTVQSMSLAVESTDALIWAGWASLALGSIRQAEQHVKQALQMVNYWRVACLDLAAILLALRSDDYIEWAWQIVGYCESRYARHLSPVAQETLHRFLTQAMRDVPNFKTVELKAQGQTLDEETLHQQIITVLN